MHNDVNSTDEVHIAQDNALEKALAFHWMIGIITQIERMLSPSIQI